MPDLPTVEERAKPRGLDALRAVCQSLEDWSKELGAIAGFERMAYEALTDAGVIRGAITTLGDDLETLFRVRRFLNLPETISRPGLYSRLVQMKTFSESFLKGVECYALVEGPEGELARLKLENAELKIRIGELTRGIVNGDAKSI